jgi:uncharacterized protein HemY
MLAYEEAIRHDEMALQVLEQRAPADAERRCKLLLGLGEAYTKAGEFRQAIKTLHEAAARARQLGSPLDLAMDLAAARPLR